MVHELHRDGFDQLFQRHDESIPTPVRPTTARARGSAYWSNCVLLRGGGRGCCRLRRCLDQTAERLRRESTASAPMRQALLVDLERRLAVDGLHLLGRIEGTDVLEEPTATGGALVRDDDAIEGPLF